MFLINTTHFLLNETLIFVQVTLIMLRSFRSVAVAHTLDKSIICPNESLVSNNSVP